MQGIIDSHIHAYPAELAVDPVAWAAANGEPYWGGLVAASKLQDWAEPARMLADMDAAGVACCIVQGWYWQRQENCAAMNRWGAALARAHPGRFAALASVQPAAGDRAVDEVCRAFDDGCVGLGELHPAVQGWSLESAVWERIATICVERCQPVCFHATEPVGPDYAGKTETPLADYVALARRFPELKIVLAHWGGGLPFFMMNRWTAKTLRNVYFDTAASPLLYDSRVWAAAVNMAGAEHILYGSDYPLRVYPSRQSMAEMRLLRDEALAKLPEDTIEAVMRGNAQRVFGIA